MDRCAHSLRVFCFGGFRIEVDGEKTITFSTDKSRALLVYLAMESGRAFRRSHLAGLLWSDLSEEQGLHNLRQTLSLLRKTWEGLQYDVPLLLTDRDLIQIHPQANLWVDTVAFDKGLCQAYRYLHNRSDLARLNIRWLIRALAWFHAPFLDRFELDNSPLFDEWALSMRERTNQGALEALALLCEYYERRAEYPLAVDAARRIVELAPWDENAHTSLMRLLAIDQQWSAAQNQYFQLKHYLKRNLDVEPAQETNTLYQKIRSAAGLKHPFPTQFPVSVVRLPVLVEMIGRDMEIDEIVDMLANPKIRLITVTGMGGIGKTHLVVEIGRILAGIFGNGVVFVPLLNLSTHEQFLSALAKGLGLSLSENRRPDTQIWDFLRQKLVLLILDNFEQFLEEKQNLDFIVDILTNAPRVKIVVTSRERLNLQEEYRFVLDGLSYPPEVFDHQLPTQNFEAVALFENRAKKLNQNFRLNANNLVPILKICNLLQGHPLGIELVTSMAPPQDWEDLLAEFVNSMHDLESQFANAPANHKTLRAVFDASWRRLSPEQQQILSKLSVCRGGFNEKAANFIAQASQEFLKSMLNKSLLRQNLAGRFEFHEAIRQYAEEKLRQDPGAEQALVSFTDYFSQFLQTFVAITDFTNRLESLNWIDLEFDNLRIAWDRLIKTQRITEIGDSVDLLYQFFNIRGRFAEGITWFQAAEEGLKPFLKDDYIYGMLKTRIGSLALRARKNDLAFESLSAGRKIFSNSKDIKELAFCLIGLGGIFLRKKDYPEARACAAASLTYYQDVKDISGQSYAYYLIGLIHSRTGNNLEAKPHLTRALACGRQVGDRRRLIAPLNVLGDIACTDGDYDQAETFFLEGLEISKELNDRFNLAILLNNLATIYQYRQQYAREKAVLLESLKICRDIGDRDGEAYALNGLGEMAVVLEKFQEALDYSEQALNIAHQLEEDLIIIICLNNIGEAAFGLKNYSQAFGYFRSAALRSLNIEAMDLLSRVTINTAPVFYHNGEKEIAATLLQAALAHSATEHEFRQKAILWLKKMNLDDNGMENDSLLCETVQKIFHPDSSGIEMIGEGVKKDP